MGEPVTTLSERTDGEKNQLFAVLDKASSRFLVATRDITVETSQGDPFEDLRLTIYDQNRPCWRGFGGSSSLGAGMLQGGSITMTRPGAVVAAGDYEQVYVRNMMATLRGYPIWSPTPLPRPNLPIEISRKGVIVGDVGLVRGPGSFAVLFNIFQSADHPLNKGRVPDNFVPFRLNPSAYVTKRVFQNDAYIASPSVKVAHKEESDNGRCSTVHFEANGPDGVVLGLPCGASSEDLTDMSGLQDYIADNIFSWYVFCRKVIQWRCFNGELRIVIGTDKSTAWSQAVFASPDGISEDNFRAKFTTKKDKDGVKCVYECSGICYKVIGGPSQHFLEDIRDPDDTSSDYCSQTLFIRTLNPMLGDHYWEAYQNGDKPPSAIISIARRGLNRVASRLSVPLRALDWTKNASVAFRKLRPSPTNPVHKVTISGISERIQPHHPSNILNRKLLDKMPHTKLVMTDDYDWLSCVTVDDNFAPNTLGDVADRVLNGGTVGNYKGITFLSKTTRLSRELLNKQ